MKRLVVFLILLISSPLQSGTMGMYYSISANIETPCKDNFPSSLSYFFEAIGGWGDESEVAQVSEILEIDLSTFQVYYFPEMAQKEEEATWKDLDEFQNLVKDFIQKIEANPEYYKKVIYNPKRTRLDSLQSTLAGEIEDVQHFQDKLKEIETLRKEVMDDQSELYLYPGDHKYSSSHSLKSDLEILDSILTCYKKHGATMIQLSYM